jgi:hypothetical protein
LNSSPTLCSLLAAVALGGTASLRQRSSAPQGARFGSSVQGDQDDRRLVSGVAGRANASGLSKPAPGSHRRSVREDAPASGGGWRSRPRIADQHSEAETTVFFLSFFPRFVEASLPATPKILVLAGTFIALGRYGWPHTSRYLATVIVRPSVKKRLDRFVGSTLVALGVRFAGVDSE